MNRYEGFSRGMLVLFCSFLTFAWIGVAAAQMDGPTATTEKKGAMGPADPTEQESGALELQSRMVSPRTGLLKDLLDARMAGDREAVARIEAQLPKPEQKGDSNGPLTLRPCLSKCGPGDRMHQASGPQFGELPGAQSAGSFMNDIHVRVVNPTTMEWNHSMASDSDGNLYVAWQDDLQTNHYIQIYWSRDDGNTWTGYGYIDQPGADLKEPSIAVGVGAEDELLVAYIVDDGVNIPVPEVAVADLGIPNFTFASVPIWSYWDGYSKPVIITESPQLNAWYAYLTCEGAYDLAADDIDICSFRSGDYGATWTSPLVPFGDYDTETWIDPDITFGTTYYRALVCCYNETREAIYTIPSDDFLQSYKAHAEFFAFGLYSLPTFPADPEIAAAVGHDNVMVTCTRLNGGYNVPGQGYSQDAGATWSTCWPLFSSPTYELFSVELTANQGGGSWHM